MLATTQGSLGEKHFEIECMKRSIEICTPVIDKFGYDFIVNNGEWVKVQVKSCSKPDMRYNNDNSFKFNIRRGAKGDAYVDGDFDYLAAYIIPKNIWYIIPFNLLNSTTIRVTVDGNRCKFKNYKWNFDLLKAGCFTTPPKERLR